MQLAKEWDLNIPIANAKNNFEWEESTEIIPAKFSTQMYIVAAKLQEMMS